jgi:hypothetical protein
MQAEVREAEKVKTKRPVAFDDLSPNQIRDCVRSVELYPSKMSQETQIS